jgi:hypothetical protein
MFRKSVSVYMRFEVLTAVKMSMLFFWVVTPCVLVHTRCWTQLHSCVNISGSCCQRLAMSHAAPAGSREVTVAFRFISERTVYTVWSV